MIQNITNNFWAIAIGASLALHLLVLFGLPMLPTVQQKKQVKTRTIHLIRKPVPQAIKPKPVSKSSFAPPPPKYVDFLGATSTKSDALVSSSSTANKPETNFTKEITLSEQTINKELTRLPAYANYYQLIRNKIRHNAFSHYDSQAVGEVLINFTILNNGQLEIVALSDDSTGTDALKTIALNSIKDASPFPEFPNDLKSYKRLQFSISICFKNR